MSVLRARGFEGSSLNDLACAAGLQKASLYHRFPGGKNEIAVTVIQYVHSWIHDNIYKVLTDDTIPAGKRLNKAIENIRALYQDGENSCIFNTLALDSGLSIVGDEINKSMHLWIEAFTAFGISLGFSKSKAISKACDSLITIQGSLIVSKGLKNTEFFRKSLATIKNSYTGEK